MKVSDVGFYKCPACLSGLSISQEDISGEIIREGELKCAEGHFFPVSNYLPDFTWPKELAIVDKHTRELYDKLAEEYDKFASIPFQTFGEEEYRVREKMTDKLKLQPGSKVLEIGGGDGRAAEHIVKRLGNSGKLYFQELSVSFLMKARQRLIAHEEQIEFSIANASYLSFPDNYFDAALHFGGINTFSEIKRCLSELARVVKPGGVVVIGDEGIGPWLRDSQFGKIMINSNPLIGYKVPIELLPLQARDVKVEWIMMGAFFLIEFTVGEGEPVANYHIPISSERGGTHWTRYFGNLEGISDEAKKLAYEARAKTGKSMFQWLDDVVTSSALKDINDNSNKG